MRIYLTGLLIQMVTICSVHAFAQQTDDNAYLGEIQDQVQRAELGAVRKKAEAEEVARSTRLQAERNVRPRFRENPFAVGFQKHEWGSFFRSTWDQWLYDSRSAKLENIQQCDSNQMQSEFQYRRLGNFISEEANRVQWVYNDASRAEGRGDKPGDGILAAETRIGVLIGKQKINAIKTMSLRRVEALKKQIGLTTEEIIDPKPSSTVLQKITNARLTSDENIEVLALRDYGPYLVPTEKTAEIQGLIPGIESDLEAKLKILDFTDPNRSDLAQFIKENHFDITMANHNGAYAKNLSTSEKVKVVIVKTGTAVILLTYGKIAKPLLTKVAGPVGKYVYGLIAVKNPGGNLKKLLWNYVGKTVVAGVTAVAPEIPKYVLGGYLASRSGEEAEQFIFYAFNSAFSTTKASQLASDYLTQLNNLCDLIACYKKQTDLRNQSGYKNTSDFSPEAKSALTDSSTPTTSHHDWLLFCAKAKPEIAQKLKYLASRQGYVFSIKLMLHSILPTWFGAP
ncbi:MAG: hypothetical protein K2X47_08610 [Bdellovibrionales bacterium]|nr:hypothetical protein [Bdellovibrionales bacterium]